MSFTHRMTRILVYTGTAESIANASAKRSVKGTHILHDLVISEAIAGDLVEILDDSDAPFSAIILECAEADGLDVAGQEPYDIFNGLLDIAKRREKYRLTAHIRNKADAFQQEHLTIDPNTSAVEGRQEQLDYWNGLLELAEDLEAL